MSVSKKTQQKKKYNKKINIKNGVFGIVIALTLFFTISSVFAAEPSKFTVTANKTTVKKGDTVTFTINLENEKEYNSYEFYLNFDPEKLEYKSYKQVADDTSTCEEDPNFDQEIESCHPYESPSGVFTDKLDEGKLVWVGLFSNSTESDDAKIGSVTFIVKDTASGPQTVSLSRVKLQKALGDGEETLHDVETEDGSVFVEVPLDGEPTLSSTNLEFDLGDTENITKDIIVNYSPSDTTETKNYTFTSNNTDVVTVDENGKVTAVGIGNTTISVSAFGRNYTVNVSVLSHITKIELNKTKLEMDLEDNKNKTLTATITPTNTTDNTTITWESLDENIVTVDADGNLIAIAPGTTTIKATTSNNLVATCEVTVVVPVKTAVFTENNQDTIDIEISRNESKTLNVTINPTNTTDQIEWTSDDESIVTVSNDGELTGVAGGTAKVTGKIRDITLEANVTVVVKAESITLNKTEILDMLPSQTNNTLEATIVPGDTTNKKITWTSSTESVATVDANGIITAIAPGTTTITASIDGKTATCTVKVLVPINSFTVNQSEVTLSKNDSNNNTTELKVVIGPDNAEEDKTVTWSSADETIATVEKNTGKVKAIGAGETVITGTLKNGMKVTTKVYVNVITENMEYSAEEIINIGESKKVVAKITPTDSTEGITYTSNNDSIAKVDNDGTIHAIAKGTAIITATSGAISKNCTVTVNVPIISIKLNQSDTTLNKGQSLALNPVINPGDATDSTVTYTSSDSKVATVDVSGNVVAIAKGTTTITATAGGKSDSFVLTVLVPITSFKLDDAQETVELIKNDTLQLKTTINPNASETTDDTTVTWTSSDNTIAKVDKNGLVTTLKAGNVKITGTLKNGMNVVSNITVKIIPVESISLTQKDLNILKNEKHKISIKVNPTNSTEITDVVWSSSDNKIATIDKNGVIKGMAKGKVTIKATMVTSTGTFEDETEVTVEEIALESIKVTNSTNKISIGEKLKLDVQLNPTNTTDDVKLTYKSSDESIAKVDKNGVVTGLKSGKVTITVTAENGIETSFEITVNNIVSPQTGITPIMIYITVAIISIVGITFVLKKKVNL